jgi:hypothetical protein
VKNVILPLLSPQAVMTDSPSFDSSHKPDGWKCKLVQLTEAKQAKSTRVHHAASSLGNPKLFRAALSHASRRSHPLGKSLQFLNEIVSALTFSRNRRRFHGISNSISAEKTLQSQRRGELHSECEERRKKRRAHRVA